MAATPIEVFFVERFVQLARPGGLVAAIVPESILAGDQLAALRTWLMESMQVLAVIALPQKVFSGVGANARTGVIFGRRYTRHERDGAEPIGLSGQGCRLPKGMDVATVVLMSPDTSYPDWSLDDYLKNVPRRIEKAVRDGQIKRVADYD
jgi:hypothetical protein